MGAATLISGIFVCMIFSFVDHWAGTLGFILGLLMIVVGALSLLSLL